MITSEIAITPANFIQIGLGISFLRMRDFAHPLIVSAFFSFFLVLPIVCSQDAHLF